MLAIKILKDFEQTQLNSTAVNTSANTAERGPSDLDKSENSAVNYFLNPKPQEQVEKKEEQFSWKLLMYKLKGHFWGILVVSSHIGAIFLIRYVGKKYLK